MIDVDGAGTKTGVRFHLWGTRNKPNKNHRDERTDHCILPRSPNVGVCSRPAQSKSCTKVRLEMKTGLDHLSNAGGNLNQTTLCARAHNSRAHGVSAVGASMWAVDACAHVHPSARDVLRFEWVSMLLIVIGVRQLTWQMISMATPGPAQALAVPRKRTLAPFMSTGGCARLSMVPSMATAKNAKILAVRRTSPETVVYAWRWWPMGPRR